MTPTIPTPGDVVDRSRSSTNAVAPTAPDTPSGAALDALRETDIARAHSLFTAVRRRLARLDDVPDSAPITSHLAAYNTHAVLPDIQALLAIGTALLTEHTALRAERDEQARQALARYKELCASGDEVSRLNEANAALSTRLAVAGEERDTRQREIAAWTRETFGERTMTPTERAARFIEEAIELAQASGLPADMIVKLMGHVYAKPVGEPAQELGGVGITLLALAEALGCSASATETAEWGRVLTKGAEHFRARHAAKAAVGICFDTDPISSDADAARRSAPPEPTPVETRACNRLLVTAETMPKVCGLPTEHEPPCVPSVAGSGAILYAGPASPEAVTAARRSPTTRGETNNG